MKQATESGFYATADGGEVFVRAGVVRPDAHPDVQHLPSIFRTVDAEEPPVQVRVPPRRDTRAAQAPGKASLRS